MTRFLLYLALMGYGFGQAIPASAPSPSTPTPTITGQIQTATGGPIKNGTLSFTLSQPAVSLGTAAVAQQAGACYTSNQGNVAGIPDPVVAPVTSVNTGTGTLAAGMYYVVIYYINANGQVSAPSPEQPVSLTSAGSIVVNPPVLQPPGAFGYGVAIGTSQGGETIQTTIPGFPQYQQTSALVAGARPVANNNSSCYLWFSDALVPTGTYYTVNLLNKNGSQIVGFPQAWCTYGGQTGTINVSQGAPTGNCNTNGVFYPTPILSNPGGTSQSIGALSVSGLLASASDNSVLNPLTFSGSDIGAQINAAAASCALGTQCHILVPASSQTSFSTTITFVPNETVECIRHGLITNAAAPNALLKYTGSGVAVSMPTSSGRFIGCDLDLGTSATVGIYIGGNNNTAYSNHIEDASIRDGGTGTTLVRISCGTAATCEDNQIINSRLSNFTGTGIETDYSNDTHIVNVTAYGANVSSGSNSTSTTLIIDSQAGGVNVNGLIGGSSGAHGMVVRHTLGGLYPTFGFIWNFECDIATSDCIVFDRTLNSAIIDYTLLDCWAAGSAGSGIHISGGSGIIINSCTIRTNRKDGITIDEGGSGVSTGIEIVNNIIQGNNTSSGSFNGITISNHPDYIGIIGNHINNYPEPVGDQRYAVSATSDVEGLRVIGNDCSNNVSGCTNLGSVTASKLTYFGNINMASGATAEPNYWTGNLSTAGAATVTGTISTSTGYQNSQSVTFAAQSSAGSGATTPVCASGVICTPNYGTITMTLGSSGLASGDIAKVSWSTAFSHRAICAIQAYDQTASSTLGNVIADQGHNTTSAIFVFTPSALTANHALSVNYVCF